MRRKFSSPLCYAAYGILSAALVVCLLVGPLCADRCAARACPPASTSESADGCHHSAVHDASTAILAIGQSSPCASGEILYTAPRLASLTAAAKSHRAATPFHVALYGAALPAGIEAYDSGPPARVSLRDAGSSTSPSLPLRI